MPSPPQILRELAEAAIQWRRTKVTYLAVSNDKRSKEADVAAARRLHMQAVLRLEKAVIAFEKLNFAFKRGGSKAVQQLQKKPLDWKKMIDGVAMAAGALSKATDGQATSIAKAKVIDVQAER